MFTESLNIYKAFWYTLCFRSDNPQGMFLSPKYIRHIYNRDIEQHKNKLDMYPTSRSRVMTVTGALIRLKICSRTALASCVARMASSTFDQRLDVLFHSGDLTTKGSHSVPVFGRPSNWGKVARRTEWATRAWLGVERNQLFCRRRW